MVERETSEAMAEAPKQFVRWVSASGRKFKGLRRPRAAGSSLYEQILMKNRTILMTRIE